VHRIENGSYDTVASCTEGDVRPLYLKGVAPKHVRIEQLFRVRGVMPSVYIVVLCMAMLYMWPEAALWLPSVLYG
jgi:TRAP-type mannitol/chloroaromatic compound transport system permease large subunit